MKWLARLLERLGIIKPRYREGWPRGVKPAFPEIEQMREKDSELFNSIAHLPPSIAISKWRERYPEDFNSLSELSLAKTPN